MEQELSAEPDSYENPQTDNEWAISNLLSLGKVFILVRGGHSTVSPNLFRADGGGIRGYWSLLALQTLMQYIAEEEKNFDDGNDEEIIHSFHPHQWPNNVSHIPMSDERRRVERARDPDEKCRTMLEARRFLPCHYFDHICGSSTGA